MRFMEVLSVDSSYFTQLTKKLAPPLVTLLSAEPEIQFVALRNINLIVQKRWGISNKNSEVSEVKKNNCGESGYRSRYLSHAKRALYHLS